ncbi:hypothetical protein [Sediminibacterium ginsengisoli]|uniref:RHS repeat-associated core domain-containing protein n=1 Tax=Sediminibacterium ginsengisoli TaxID=413434 RepID=A0A1T4MNC2_9BACT|nr:hypothetical protein [Sediminibacterium ginsengisoli]SJZ68512.1 hypothetical protein SAMN04488132_103481 [Sediminibacterium ginsengisoli]
MKKSALFILILFQVAIGFAQKYDPFKSIGKKSKVLTAYGDRFVEDFDYDTIQRIGSVLFNIKTKQIVELLPDEKIFKKYSNNSSASRWYQVDPLAEKGKNISYSPYTFVLNNPISYADNDGRDAVKVIDAQNKTITITAVYYVATAKGFKGDPMVGYNAKDVERLNKSINSELNGGNGYKVSEGDYAGYTVKFNLTFKDGGTLDNSKEASAGEAMDGHPIGNSFTVVDGNRIAYFKEKENEDDGTTSQVGGATRASKEIMMNSNTDTKRNRIHEIFHTLFFNQDGAAKGIGSYSRADYPNQADINTLINNTKLPAVEKKKDDEKQ